VVKRVKFDASASGETGSPSGVRQSETRRDGRFCADIGAEPLDRVKDMPFVSRLDLVTKSIRQNDPEFAGNALGIRRDEERPQGLRVAAD
jgi:hypothetical protein